MRGMAQGKFDVVVREMQRTAMDLLGISELHWVGMGHLKSGGHTMFYSGNNSIKRNGVVILCGKTLAQCMLGYNPISNRIISVRLQGRSINTTVFQVYVPTTESDEDVHYDF